MNYDVKIDKYGNKRYYVNNILHWEDGPAVEGVGEKHWFKNGKRHREDGPAVEWANGTKFWYKDGKKQRKDGPAVEYANGYRDWCIMANILAQIMILQINLGKNLLKL